MILSLIEPAKYGMLYMQRSSHQIPLHLSQQILQNTRNLLMEYLLKPVPLLHTRAMMTLFTFRLPFLQIILFM